MIPISRLQWWSAFATLLLGLAGCGEQLERSESATGLPALERDPRESNTAQVGQWPGWRGRNASGISPDTNLPIEWSGESGFVWRVSVPGQANSSPVVWDDWILLTSAIGVGDAQILAVLCYDRVDGSLRWRRDLAAAGGRTHVKNGYASATVATDGRAVYANFGSAGLFALDMQGDTLWTTELGGLDHVWGAASSPVLFEDLVIQLCDQEDQSYLAAFDKTSGVQRWRTERDSYGCWTTPVLVAADNRNTQRAELVVNGTGTATSGGGWVIAYNPRTGDKLWRVQGTTDIVCPTAIVGGGLVFSTSGRNGPTIAIRPGGSGDVTETHVEWKLRRGGPYVPTGLVYRNRLYLIADGGVLSCFNAGDGELVWRKRLGGTFTASLIAGDGKIYATDERGKMYVVTAGDKFELIAMNEMNERILTTPAISRGELVIRTESHLTLVPATYATKQTAEPGAVDVDNDVASPSDRTILVDDVPENNAVDGEAP